VSAGTRPSSTTRRIDDARAAHETLIDSVALFGRYGGLAGLKAACQGAGLDLGPARSPLPTVSPEEGLKLQGELDAVWPEWRVAQA